MSSVPVTWLEPRVNGSATPWWVSLSPFLAHQGLLSKSCTSHHKMLLLAKASVVLAAEVESFW